MVQHCKAPSDMNGQIFMFPENNSDRVSTNAKQRLQLKESGKTKRRDIWRSGAEEIQCISIGQNRWRNTFHRLLWLAFEVTSSFQVRDCRCVLLVEIEPPFGVECKDLNPFISNEKFCGRLKPGLMPKFYSGFCEQFADECYLAPLNNSGHWSGLRSGCRIVCLREFVYEKRAIYPRSIKGSDGDEKIPFDGQFV
jgi:hypothetical protein